MARATPASGRLSARRDTRATCALRRRTLIEPASPWGHVSPRLHACGARARMGLTMARIPFKAPNRPRSSGCRQTTNITVKPLPRALSSAAWRICRRIQRPSQPRIASSTVPVEHAWPSLWQGPPGEMVLRADERSLAPVDERGTPPSPELWPIEPLRRPTGTPRACPDSAHPGL